MYLNRPARRRSSPRRIVIYLALIAAGLLFLRFQDDLRRPFVPTPTATRAAQSYVAEAQSLYEAGRLSAAIDAYTQAIALEPNRVDVLVSLSRILALTDRTDEALQRAQRAAQIDPRSAPARAALAMAYNWRGTWLALHGRDAEATEHNQKALSEAQQAALLDPKYPEAYAYLAEVLIDLNDLAGAIDAANKAEALAQEARDAARLADRKPDPKLADAYRALAYVREWRGNYLRAVDAYRTALEIDPSVPYLWVALGRNYRVLGVLTDARYIKDAIAAFQHAIQIDSRYGPAYDELGWTHYNTQDYRQAVDELEKAVQVDPNSWSAYGHLGTAYYSNRNYEGAAATLPRAIELMNETFDADRYCVNATSRACDRLIEAYYTLGLADYYLCRCDQSEVLFNKALALRPDEPNALEGLRLCREESSDTCREVETPTP
jgi:tetratricopeptide (TPR) repeat protein